MVREAGSRARLARLLRELAVDRAALGARATEVDELLRTWPPGAPIERVVLLAVTVNLHGYYTALETLFERVARLLDEEVPTGPAWHTELLSQMQAPVPDLRPAVLPEAVASDVHELRKFRHFFRNAYTVNFDPALVREHAERLCRVHGPIDRALGELTEHLSRVLAPAP
jgi:hypothetical protein